MQASRTNHTSSEHTAESMGTRAIGLQAGSLIGGFNIDIVFAAEKACRQRGYTLILFEGGRESDNPHQLQQKFIYNLISRGNIDSLIVTNCKFDELQQNGGTYQLAAGNDVPRVYTMPMSDGSAYIYAGFEENYRALIEHLVTVHHCKTFNVITGPKDNTDSMARLAICTDVLAHHDIRLAGQRIFTGNFEEDSGNAAMEYFSSQGLLPADCIICMNDDMATGVSEYAKSHRLSIPQDFRLVGFDGVTSTAFYDVPLSTLCINVEGVGQKAAEHAITLAEGGKIPGKLEIESLPKYRKSCGCIPADDTKTEYIGKDGTAVPYPQDHDSSIYHKYTSLEHGLFLIQRFTDTLTNTLSIRQIIRPLKKELLSLHVKSCAVVLFRHKLDTRLKDGLCLPATAELLFSYEEPAQSGLEPQELPRSLMVFNPQKRMLPEGSFREKQSFLIVRTLYYDHFICGYMVFNPGTLAKPLIDTSCSMISSLLASAIVVTERSAIEAHQENMLRQLQVSNSKLIKLSGESLTDELTKLYNRRGIMNFGQQTIDLAVEMQGKGLVFYADMDGLKAINDTYGHDAGDLAITTMGKILKSTFREQDIIGRMGGDEFVIVAGGIAEEIVPLIKERLDSAAEEWYQTNKPPFRLSISFGKAAFYAGNSNLETLLALADKELYKEKEKKHARRAQKESVLPPEGRA